MNLDNWCQQQLFNESGSLNQRLCVAILLASMAANSSSPHVDQAKLLIQQHPDATVRIKQALDSARSAAINGSTMAYAPYSKFNVGCAMISQTLEVFSGCNVENASYGLTICAERNAVASAVNSGHRDFIAVIVHTHMDEVVWPCGACRQVLSEFGKEMICLATSGKGVEKWLPFNALIPFGFNAAVLTGTKA